MLASLIYSDGSVINGYVSELPDELPAALTLHNDFGDGISEYTVIVERMQRALYIKDVSGQLTAREDSKWVLSVEGELDPVFLIEKFPEEERTETVKTLWSQLKSLFIG